MKKALYIIPVVALVLLVLAVPALAEGAEGAEGASNWRNTWNQVWKIINFLILAFLFVKMGKEPIKAFISGQQNTVAEELKAMEDAKAEAQAELKETEARIANLNQELDDFRQLISDQAAKEREQMMEDARYEADAILDRTKRQSEMALLSARRRMAAELVALAGAEAEKILLANITPSDQERMLVDFTDKVLEQAKA